MKGRRTDGTAAYAIINNTGIGMDNLMRWC